MGSSLTMVKTRTAHALRLNNNAFAAKSVNPLAVKLPSRIRPIESPNCCTITRKCWVHFDVIAARRNFGFYPSLICTLYISSFTSIHPDSRVVTSRSMSSSKKNTSPPATSKPSGPPPVKKQGPRHSKKGVPKSLVLPPSVHTSTSSKPPRATKSSTKKKKWFFNYRQRICSVVLNVPSIIYLHLRCEQQAQASQRSWNESSSMQ